MYKNISADEYRKHLGLPADYRVDAMLCYGTLYEQRVLSQLARVIDELGLEAEINKLPDDFLRFAKEIRIGDKVIWFAVGYGGAWLSEYLHWACIFGSKKNLLLGSCGGLKPGMKQGDFIVPENSFSQESSAKMYNRDSDIHSSDNSFSEVIAQKLSDDGSKVWRGSMVTCQAMLAETLDDIKKWSADGYYGVEMESSTVFAVSKHFNVPAAASLYVGDNLIEEHNNTSDQFALEGDMREQNQLKQIRIGLTELAL